MTNELAEKPMSYEEMIDTLKGLVFGTFDRTTSKEREALSRAIDLLSNSDEDCISRKAVLDLVEDMTDQFGVEHRVITEGVISMLPPVTPKPKTDVLDKIRAEITTLQNRCYSLTKGTMCAFCKFECKYRAESEDKE